VKTKTKTKSRKSSSGSSPSNVAAMSTISKDAGGDEGKGKAAGWKVWNIVCSVLWCWRPSGCFGTV